MRLAQGFLAGGALALAGCIGWTDAYSGPAYTTAGREKRNGPTFGVESIFSPRPHTALNRGSQTFPVAIHNGFQLTLSPDLKTFSWLTGVALWGHPEPVSGYALAGTNLHVDLLNSRFSFGNFQPYGEVGVAGRLGNRGDDEDGLIVTLGMQFMFLYNYLAQNEPASDGYISIKFGLGWDVH